MSVKKLKPGIVAAFAAIYFIWGSTYLAIKISIETIPPFTMTALRAITAGVVLYGWGRWRGGLAPTTAQWGYGALVGAFLFLGGHGGLGWAEQRVPSGVASLFIATLPLWMTLIEMATDREVELNPAGWTVRRKGGGINLRTFAGLLAGVVGIITLLGPGVLFGSEPVDLTGGLVLVLCAFSWAVGSALARRSGQPSSLTVAMGTYLLTGGGLLFLAGGIAGEFHRFRPTSVSASSLAALAFLIVFGTVVAFSAYTWLLRRTSMAAVSTYAFVNPVVAVVLGWGLGGEALNLRVLVAAVLVVGAVGLILTGANPPSTDPRRETGRDRTSLAWPNRERDHDRTGIAWPNGVQGWSGVRGPWEGDGNQGARKNPREPGSHDSPSRPRRRDRDPGPAPVEVHGEPLCCLPSRSTRPEGLEPPTT